METPTLKIYDAFNQNMKVFNMNINIGYKKCQSSCSNTINCIISCLFLVKTQYIVFLVLESFGKGVII